MELNYYFANEHYQKSLTAKKTNATEVLNIKQFQDEVDKKMRHYELIIGGFLFPLKVLKKLFYAGLGTLFAIAFLIILFHLLNGQTIKGQLSDLQYVAGFNMTRNYAEDVQFIAQNEDKFIYYNCDIVGKNLKCQTKANLGQIVIPKSSDQPAELAKPAQEMEVTVQETKKTESEPKKTEVETPSVVEVTEKKEKPKVEIAEIQDVNNPPSNSIYLQNVIQRESTKDSHPTSSNGPASETRPHRKNPRADLEKVMTMQTNAKRYQQPSASQPQIQNRYASSQTPTPTPQARPQYTQAQQTQYAYQHTAAPQVSTVNGYTLAAPSRNPYNNYHRLLQANISSENSRPDAPLFDETTYLIFDQKVYHLDKIASNGFTLGQKTILVGISLIMIYLLVIAATYIFIEKNVGKRINETIINMVIMENNSGGIYKYFIYGDYKYVGVKVVIKDAKIEDLKSESEAGDSYMLDPNQIQARKMNLVKKNKKNNLLVKGSYKNMSNSKNESSAMDESVSKVNETVG